MNQGICQEPKGEAEPRFAIVKSSELGVSCWLPRRFIQGGRCERVHACNYPEKKRCKAVQAEVDFLSRQVIEIQEEAMKRQQQIAQRIREFLELQGKK